MASSTDIELRAVGQERKSSSPPQEFEQQQPNNDDASGEQEAVAIPPPDRGRDAYLVLAGCALAQAPAWGYSLSFGVVQAHLSSTAAGGSGPTGTFAAIGTTLQGIMYLATPLLLALLTALPRLRAWCVPLALVLAGASLAGSSFLVPSSSSSSSSNAEDVNVGALVATQGVLYALGSAALFAPASLCLDEWFVTRKGLAYGVMWAAKASVGGGAPSLMAALLARLGAAGALRVWAAVSSALCLPLIVLLKPRAAAAAVSLRSSPASSSRPASPQPPPPPRHRRSTLTFLRHNTLFWMLQVGNVVQALGYLMPSTYLASYAASLGLSPGAGALLLSVFSLASVPGAIVIGLLGDRLAATTVVLISSAGSALAAFLLWGCLGGGLTGGRLVDGEAGGLSVLAGFAVAYGFFAGGFSSTWPGVLHEVRRADAAADTGLAFGLLMGGRGLGFVLSGPVSGALLRDSSGGGGIGGSSGGASGGSASPASAYAARYGPMVVCTGLTAALGAWGWLWNLGKPCRRMGARLLRLCRA